MQEGAASIEDHWLTVEGLRQRVWLVRPPGPGPFPAVVWNHGSQVTVDNLGAVRDCSQEPQVQGDGLAWRRWSESEGVVLIIPEGRGYGGSEGQRLAEVLHDPAAAMDFLQARARDANAAVAWAVGTGEIFPAQVVAAGASHGGVVSLLASASRCYAGTVIQATGPWYGRADVGAGALRAAAARGQGPLLIQHMRTDTLVPIEVSRMIHRAAREASRSALLREYPGAPGVEGHFLSDPRNRRQWAVDHDAFVRVCLTQRA